MATCVPVLARPPASWSQTLQARTTSACVCDGRRDEADAGWRCQRWPGRESGEQEGRAWCHVSFKCGVGVRTATDPRLFWAYCRQHDAIEEEAHHHLRHYAHHADRVVAHQARSNTTGARSKAAIDNWRSVRAWQTWVLQVERQRGSLPGAQEACACTGDEDSMGHGWRCKRWPMSPSPWPTLEQALHSSTRGGGAGILNMRKMDRLLGSPRLVGVAQNTGNHSMRWHDVLVGGTPAWCYVSRSCYRAKRARYTDQATKPAPARATLRPTPAPDPAIKAPQLYWAPCDQPGQHSTPSDHSVGGASVAIAAHSKSADPSLGCVCTGQRDWQGNGNVCRRWGDTSWGSIAWCHCSWTCPVARRSEVDGELFRMRCNAAPHPPWAALLDASDLLSTVEGNSSVDTEHCQCNGVADALGRGAACGWWRSGKASTKQDTLSAFPWCYVHESCARSRASSAGDGRYVARCIPNCTCAGGNAHGDACGHWGGDTRAVSQLLLCGNARRFTSFVSFGLRLSCKLVRLNNIVQHSHNALCSSLLSAVSFEQWCWVKFPSACADAKASKAVPGQWWRHCKPDNATKRVPGDNDDGCGCGESGQPSDSKLGSYCRAWATLPSGDRATAVPARSWCWTLSYCLRAHVTHTRMAAGSRASRYWRWCSPNEDGWKPFLTTMAPTPVPVPTPAPSMAPTSLPSMAPTVAPSPLHITPVQTGVTVPASACRCNGLTNEDGEGGRCARWSAFPRAWCFVSAACPRAHTAAGMHWAFCNTSITAPLPVATTHTPVAPHIFSSNDLKTDGTYVLTAHFAGCACLGVKDIRGFGDHCARFDRDPLPWCYTTFRCPSARKARLVQGGQTTSRDTTQDASFWTHCVPGANDGMSPLQLMARSFSTASPTLAPTQVPSSSPTPTPTLAPTGSPTAQPTPIPTPHGLLASAAVCRCNSAIDADGQGGRCQRYGVRRRAASNRDEEGSGAPDPFPWCYTNARCVFGRPSRFRAKDGKLLYWRRCAPMSARIAHKWKDGVYAAPYPGIDTSVPPSASMPASSTISPTLPAQDLARHMHKKQDLYYAHQDAHNNPQHSPDNGNGAISNPSLPRKDTNNLRRVQDKVTNTVIGDSDTDTVHVGLLKYGFGAS